MARKSTNLFARFDLDYADHPKIAVLSDGAFRAHVEMILYARKYLTDGRIPKRFANRFGFDSLSELKANDDECPSLIELDNGDYMLHDYVDHQETREEVEARRLVNAQNGKRGGRPAKRTKTQSVSKSLTHSQTEPQSEIKAETETETETETDPTTPLTPNRDQTRSNWLPVVEGEVMDLLPAIPDRFAEWWDTYDKKVSRKQAEQKWRLALKKPGITAELLIQSAAAYIRHQKSIGKHPQFTKNPETWLNGEHWNDELVDLAPNRGNGPRVAASMTEADWNQIMADARAKDEADARRSA